MKKSLILGFLPFLIFTFFLEYCVTVPEEEMIPEDLEEENLEEDSSWLNFNPFRIKNKP